MANNKTYIFDLTNISRFIFGDESNRTHDTEITEIYEPDEEVTETEEGVTIKRNPNASLTLANRTIREVKSGENGDHFTVKYDMIKMFISMLADETFDIEKLTVGQQIVFNTMLSYELIKEI